MIRIGKMDRILVAIYLIAIFLLLLLPAADHQFTFLGIRNDKWMHAILFGGFSMLLRWSASGNRRADLLTLGVSSALAVAMEVAQDWVGRNPELGDIVAGLIGATVGTLLMRSVLATPFPEKLIGILVIASGLAVSCLALFADYIGLGRSSSFGSDQMAGALLGVLIVVGGAIVFFKGLPQSR